MGEVNLGGLIGSWKLVSMQFRMSDNGEILDEPMQGICTFDANGRWTVLAVPPNLIAPTNDGERAAIFNRMIAYSARCTFTANQLNAKIDAAWTPDFKGMQFNRFVDLESDMLTITSPEWEHPFFEGRKTVVVVSWERER
jgi:hypothetical protein